MSEAKKNLFNGDRDADEYVKGYLKGVFLIATITSSIVVGIGAWGALKIIDHETRIIKIESSRFTIADGALMKNEMKELEIFMTEINGKINAMLETMSEVKEILKRTAPYERRPFQN